MITEACNSNCIMCPMTEESRMHAETISDEELDEVISILNPELEHIDITGGEPFLGWDKLKRLLCSINEKCPYTSVLILTNGRALCIPQIQESIKPLLSRRYCFAIPIHSYNSNRHDAISRTRGSFNQTINGLKFLSDQHALIEIRVVIHRLNMNFFREISNMLCNLKISIHIVNLIGMEMHGCAYTNRNHLWIDYKSLFLSVADGVLALINHGVDVGIYGIPLCQLPIWARPLAKRAISDWKVRYAPECVSCEEYDSCGGMFESTYNLGLCKVLPIKQEDK